MCGSAAELGRLLPTAEGDTIHVAPITYQIALYGF